MPLWGGMGGLRAALDLREEYPGRSRDGEASYALDTVCLWCAGEYFTRCCYSECELFSSVQENLKDRTTWSDDVYSIVGVEVHKAGMATPAQPLWALGADANARSSSSRCRSSTALRPGCRTQKAKARTGAWAIYLLVHAGNCAHAAKLPDHMLGMTSRVGVCPMMQWQASQTCLQLPPPPVLKGDDLIARKRFDGGWFGVQVASIESWTAVWRHGPGRSIWNVSFLLGFSIGPGTTTHCAHHASRNCQSSDQRCNAMLHPSSRRTGSSVSTSPSCQCVGTVHTSLLICCAMSYASVSHVQSLFRPGFLTFSIVYFSMASCATACSAWALPDHQDCLFTYLNSFCLHIFALTASQSNQRPDGNQLPYRPTWSELQSGQRMPSKSNAPVLVRSSLSFLTSSPAMVTVLADVDRGFMLS